MLGREGIAEQGFRPDAYRPANDPELRLAFEIPHVTPGIRNRFELAAQHPALHLHIILLLEIAAVEHLAERNGKAHRFETPIPIPFAGVEDVQPQLSLHASLAGDGAK
jgi:hypothetical protein